MTREEVIKKIEEQFESKNNSACKNGSKWQSANNLNVSNYGLYCEIKELHKKIDYVTQLLALVRRNQFCLFEGTNEECQNFVKQWKKENGYK